MKFLLCSLILTVCAATVVHADIQQPPSADQGPTRKWGRGMSNMLFSFTEVPNTIATTNEVEGNQALGFSVLKGVGRSFIRFGIGFYEVVTAPFPLNKGKYSPELRNDVPWIHSGYEEFPPELGWESRYNYSR